MRRVLFALTLFASCCGPLFGMVRAVWRCCWAAAEFAQAELDDDVVPDHLWDDIVQRLTEDVDEDERPA